jgi:nitroreductase
MLEQILEIVQSSPTAGNLQAYEIVIVKDSQARETLSTAALGQKFIAQAPVVLAFMALPLTSGQRYRDRGVKLYSIQDATIACTYAMLAASALGLSSTWVGAFDEDAVKEVLKADTSHVPIALLPIGYAAQQPFSTPRRTLKQIAREI